jgi:hypothetical protein
MKKQLRNLFKAALLLVLVVLMLPSSAQRRYAPKAPTGESDFELSISNIVQTSDRELEFDIFILDADASQDFELATFQAGILLNSAIYTGGTMSVALVSSSSSLLASQVPTTTSFAATLSGYPGVSLIRMAARTPPGTGNGTIISKVSPGDRIIRMRLTSTVPFTSNSTPDFSFTSNTVSNPFYGTKVAQYIAGTNTQLVVSPGVNALVAENPVLNPGAVGDPPIAYNVSGSGSYCEGTGGLMVGLDGSQLGVDYTMMPGSVVVAGTGSAISFGMQLAGTYTVSGTADGTVTTIAGTSAMLGSAVITEIPATTVEVTESACDTYTWAVNNVTYTESGNYTEVVGCVTNILHLTITASSTVEVTEAACDTYTWAVNGVTYNTSGDYTFVDGCITNILHLTITTSVTPAVSIVEDANNVVAGTLVTFTPTPVNGGTPTYQWYVNGILAGSGATYAYVAENGDQVYVVMTTSLGCVTFPTATSNTIIMTVNPVVPATTTWTGAVDSEWFNPGNWGNGIPGTISQVIIPGGLPNYPTLMLPTSIAGITINNGGSFIGSEFLTTASALVKRDVVNSDFHLISSPVTTTTFGEVFPLNQLQVWAREYNETTGDWDNLTIGDFMSVGKGYSVQMTQPQTALFEGTLNSTPVTMTLAKQNPGTDPDRVGWNLLGNPFTSAIDWDLTDHAAIDGAVYVWNGTQYISWNGTIGALSDGIIPAENAFFAKTMTDGVNVSIPLSARVHSATDFYKTAVANMLEIIAEGNSFTDKTFVHFNDQASADFDSQYDAYKLFGNENAPQLYSMITNSNLSINELPMAGNEIVDLGFTCNTTGIYSITASGTENFASDVPVILQDVKLNTYQDLKLNPVYSFSYESGENENRFKLWFQQVTGINTPVNNDLKVYSFAKTVVIENLKGLSGEVQIYDITGRILASRQLGTGLSHIQLNVVSGTYMVRLNTISGTQISKVFIR